MSETDRALPDETAAPAAAFPPPDPADAPINILLVDDEPKNLTVLETILQDPGYRLVLARSADEALLALVAQEFALAVLDIQMPDMNGFELAKLIKRRRKTAALPIIFLTAYYSQDQHVLEGYGTGAVDYLHKPVNPAILRSKTAIFATLHRKSREAESANRALQVEIKERRLAQEKLELLNANLEHLVEVRTASLRAAARHKDEFLAMLAHELRNPLVPMRNAVQVFHRTGPKEPSLIRLRDMIDRQVTHMARLVDDLLDVSRLARGRLRLHATRVDLVRIVRETAEDYRGALSASGLSLTVDLPPAPVWTHGDGVRLAQVVSNLLHNAHKFTAAGGAVSVCLEAGTDASAVIRVRDTGVGMAPGFAARVFDSFTQEEQSLDRSKGGLGMGLALVRGLVQLHGGVVEAKSAGPGQGSEFLVRLPCGAAAESPPGGEAPPAPGVSPLRILVIEDNKDSAESMRLLLDLDGHQVGVAHTGPAGIEAARSFRPQVVLCDIGLPEGMSGYDVARALREEPGLCSAYTIALTGYGRDEDKRKAQEAGFDLHMTKPVDYQDLRRALAAVAGRT